MPVPNVAPNDGGEVVGAHTDRHLSAGVGHPAAVVGLGAPAIMHAADTDTPGTGPMTQALGWSYEARG